MRKLIISLIGIAHIITGIVISQSSLAAGNAAAGKEKFQTCLGCHASEKYFNVYPSYHVPKLGGQHALFIETALKAYRSGQRSHETMKANASNLSDQDIADIAAYVSSKAFNSSKNPVPSKTAVARGKEKAGTCVACHGTDGNSPAPTFPTIAGQHADYIAHALIEYKSGKRNNPIMMPMATNLSEQDIKDLSAYFAAQDGLQTVTK